jgi:tripartite ATP-independent transporter DctM subunit
MNGLIILILFLGLLAVGVPIAYTMAFISGTYFLVNGATISVFVQRFVNSANSITLLAVPTFMFAATVMNNVGITDALFDALKVTPVCRAKGGLGHVNVLASLIFAGMSGASLADIGGLGKIEIDAMTKSGYKIEDATAVTLASSAIGPIFPPSIPLILYGLYAQVSGIRLLMAGVVPALVLTIALMLMVTYFAHKYNWPREQLVGTLKSRIKIMVRGFPALMCPAFLLGGMLNGSFSPSELASVTAVMAIFIGYIFYHRVNVRVLLDSAKETIPNVMKLLFICAAATTFAHVLTVEQVPQLLGNLLTGISTNPIVLLLIVNVILFIAGMIMDSGICMMVFTPLIVPVLTSVGVDPVHLGVIMCLNIVIGLFTPPFGTGLFLACIMTNQPFEKVVKAMVPYYIPLVGTLIIITLIPQITLWLPNLIYGV